MDPAGDWKRRAGRPRQSWLRTVETDLRMSRLVLRTEVDKDRTEKKTELDIHFGPW